MSLISSNTKGKVIGLIGGLTWLSSMDYYRLLNQLYEEKTGGSELPRIIIYSVDFGEIKVLTQSGNWDGITAIISDAARKVEAAGADCLMLGANTMHKIADAVQESIRIPLIHIAAETAETIADNQLKKVALLGTKYTMQLDFYRAKLAARGIETIIPEGLDIDIINDAIYNEMSKGNFLPETKAAYLKIIGKLLERGAEGIILGCTEIPILIKQEDCPVPVFDTTLIHATAAVRFARKDLPTP